MTPPQFPFAALVGLDTLKLALQLAAIDRHLSVLIRGDKGAAKSTAARGLAELLEPGAPFINLPIGATDDRLLGGLDVDKALKGEPALKRGLLADADRGVLYVDEVNLLPDHLADALLDAVASGLHVVEREGFSITQPASFVMVGTMNPEEGSLRPQLLDRFALAVDVHAPMDPSTRLEILARRLRFDADPASFAAEWRTEEARTARALAEARLRWSSVSMPAPVLERIAQIVVSHQVASLRADLAVVRGSRALAALEGATAVRDEHVEAVLPLALAHRAVNPPKPPRPPAAPPSPPSSDDQAPASRSSQAAREHVFESAPVAPPRISVSHGGETRGATAASPGTPRGPAVRTRQTPAPAELDVRSTVLHAIGRTGRTSIAAEDLHERVRAPQSATRFLFVVDSSGSHAIQERMRFVKGAIEALVEGAAGRRDEIAVIVCRGATASVLVQPTSDTSAIRRAIEYLPTGGRTPLAHGLELAATLVTDHTLAVVITDGHANVATLSDDPWADALAAARSLKCAALVVDSESARQASGKPARLAEALAATCIRLDDLDTTTLIEILRHRQAS